MHVFVLSCRFICMFSCKVVGFICVFLGSYLKSVDQSERRICDSYALNKSVYFIFPPTSVSRRLCVDYLYCHILQGTECSNPFILIGFVQCVHYI